MHIPDHADILPEGVDPIPFPDTKEEAEMLRCLLNAGLYPTCADIGTQREGTQREGTQREGTQREGTQREGTQRDRKDPTGDEDR
ncbi:hypothetical protein GGQ20_000697 [Salinibacter ruber]|nr:hypothetical protein [Salinibacter ruber]